MPLIVQTDADDFSGVGEESAVDDAGLGHDRRLCLSGVVCRFGKPRKLAGAAFLLDRSSGGETTM